MENICSILRIMSLVVFLLNPLIIFCAEGPNREMFLQNYGKTFLFQDKASVFKLSSDMEKKLGSLTLKAVRAACCKLLEGSLEYFDGRDRTNQCHMNALLVIMIAQDAEFRKICSRLASLSADQDLIGAIQSLEKKDKDRLRFLTLNILRCLPTPDHDFEDLVQQLQLTDEKQLWDKMLKATGRYQAKLAAEQCAQLAELRLKLVEQYILSIESIRQRIPFTIHDSLNQLCFETPFKGAVLKTLPKILSIKIFLAAVQDPELTRPPIFMKLECNKRLVGYIDHTLQKFIPHAPQGPIIFIESQSDNTSDSIVFYPETGLLKGFTPEQFIMASAVYFVETKQREGIKITEKYVPDLQQFMNTYLDIKKQLGTMIIHMWPMKNR